MSVPRHRHPVNRAHLDDEPLGARIADAVTGFLGSWRFLILQSIFVAIWIGGNVALLFHFDPFPFILLNLAFSTQAAYAAPLILLAGNRQAARDRATLEHTAKEADEEFEQNLELLRRTEAIVERIERMERVEDFNLGMRVNFDGITYAKGASALRQLVAWVGEENFLAGVRQYFGKHAWGNTELRDLLSELEATSGRVLSKVAMAPAKPCETSMSGEPSRFAFGTRQLSKMMTAVSEALMPRRALTSQ